MRKLLIVILILPLFCWAQARQDKVMQEIFQGLPVASSFEVLLASIDTTRFSTETNANGTWKGRLAGGKEKAIFGEASEIEFTFTRKVTYIDTIIGYDSLMLISLRCGIHDGINSKKSCDRIFWSLNKLLKQGFKIKDHTWFGPVETLSFTDPNWKGYSQLDLMQAYDSRREEYYINIFYRKSKYGKVKIGTFWKRAGS